MSRAPLMRVSCVTACLLAASVATVAEAGWHHRYGCGSCGSHHHHGWHRGSHGSHGSSGGSHGGSSGGSSGSPATAPKAAQPAAKTAGAVPADGTLLVLEVPERAKVFINGQATALTGGLRKFGASGLAADKRYEYDVTMIVTEGDAARVLAKKVWLAAGEEQTIAFNAAEATSVAVGDLKPELPAPATNLTVHVPADAKVWIEGRLMPGTGAVRTFGTRQLAAGQAWEDYEVRVATTVDGREQTAAKKLVLIGGRDAEVTIDPAVQSPAVEATAALR